MRVRRPKRSTKVSAAIVKTQVDGAGDDDVEKDIVHAISGVAVNLFGVVEDHVCRSTVAVSRGKTPVASAFNMPGAASNSDQLACSACGAAVERTSARAVSA
jgi:hypothetical protein